MSIVFDFAILASNIIRARGEDVQATCVRLPAPVFDWAVDELAKEFSHHLVYPANGSKDPNVFKVDGLEFVRALPGATAHG